MPTRELLAPSQRAQLTELPATFDDRALARFYTLSDHDLLLMAKSRHASLRSLQRYARPGLEAVAALTAAHDPARRRR